MQLICDLICKDIAIMSSRWANYSSKGIQLVEPSHRPLATFTVMAMVKMVRCSPIFVSPPVRVLSYLWQRTGRNKSLHTYVRKQFALSSSPARKTRTRALRVIEFITLSAPLFFFSISSRRMQWIKAGKHKKRKYVSEKNKASAICLLKWNN